MTPHMTTEEKIDQLTHALGATLESIQGLETIATAHQATIEAHDKQIETLTLLWQDLTRQWQAYLTTIRPQ